jgi:hypothetical protein
MTKQEAIKAISHYLTIRPDDTYFMPALRVALAAIEASIPRVLTLEEVIQHLDQNKPVLLQVRKWQNAQWYGNGDQISNVLFPALGTLYIDPLYGLEWRCWNAMPTAEQMAATPWTKQEADK